MSPEPDDVVAEAELLLLDQGEMAAALVESWRRGRIGAAQFVAMMRVLLDAVEDT